MSEATTVEPSSVPEVVLDPTELRRQRGLLIAAICPIKPEGTDNRYRVPSQKGKGHYLVNIDRKKGPEWQCSCADFEARKLPCKHVFAVQFVLQRETNPDGSTTVTQTLTVMERQEKAPQTVAFRATYKQNWTAYNTAQTTEKHHFQTLLSELCKGWSSRPGRTVERRVVARRSPWRIACSRPPSRSTRP